MNFLIKYPKKQALMKAKSDSCEPIELAKTFSVDQYFATESNPAKMKVRVHIL